MHVRDDPQESQILPAPQDENHPAAKFMDLMQEINILKRIRCEHTTGSGCPPDATCCDLPHEDSSLPVG